MKVYHVTKTEEGFKGILQEKVLIPGRNINHSTPLTHLSLDPFRPGSWALDVIGKDTNKAWIFELEISDDTPVQPDPTNEGELYNGKWVVVEGNLPVEIRSCVYIPNVQKWEMREIQEEIVDVAREANPPSEVKFR